MLKYVAKTILSLSKHAITLFVAWLSINSSFASKQANNINIRTISTEELNNIVPNLLSKKLLYAQLINNIKFTSEEINDMLFGVPLIECRFPTQSREEPEKINIRPFKNLRNLLSPYSTFSKIEQSYIIVKIIKNNTLIELIDNALKYIEYSKQEIPMLKKAEEENKRLYKENKKLYQKNKQLKSQIKNKDNTIDYLNNKITSLNNKIISQENTINSLQKTI